MFKPKFAAVAATVALAAPVGVVAAASSAEAATTYRSCAALTKVYPHGVAKSKAAAQRQVNQGYGRPAYGEKAQGVYWQNHGSLDRDNDGTACER